MTVELRDVLVLLPTREQLRLVVGVSVQESGADWGHVWGRVTVGVTVTVSGGRGQAAGQQGCGASLGTSGLCALLFPL